MGESRNFLSSIEHGGTKTFSQYVGIFVGFFVTILWYFCEVLLVAGGVILFSLHMTMVWDLANGAGIPAHAIDVCVSKHQSALIRRDGDSSSTAGPKARGPRPLSR